MIKTDKIKRIIPFIQCEAIYVDPLGNRMRCDLKAGHTGIHECGFSSTVIWGNDESLLPDLSRQAGQ